jgi:hypothetical protein
MPAVRFGGEGKRGGGGGESGVKRGKSVAPFSGEEGSLELRQRAWEVAAAAPGRASGGRRQWPTDRAGQPVRGGGCGGGWAGRGERWAAAGPGGGGREVGRGWAENWKWLDKILSKFI